MLDVDNNAPIWFFLLELNITILLVQY